MMTSEQLQVDIGEVEKRLEEMETTLRNISSLIEPGLSEGNCTNNCTHEGCTRGCTGSLGPSLEAREAKE